MTTDAGLHRSGQRPRFAVPGVDYGLAYPFRLAMRDLRGELGGFAIFIACITIGVAAIAGVGALGDALKAGFASHGQEMLGGDIAIARMHQRASKDERTWFGQYGPVSEAVTFRAMVAPLADPIGAGGQSSKTARVLVEVKAVDGAYPLAGTGKLQRGPSFQAAIAGENTGIADAILFERLNLKPGDKVRFGDIELALIDAIDHEPDKLSGRAVFGPRLMVSLGTLRNSGLIQPGSLMRWRYRLLATEAGKNDDILAELSKSVSDRLGKAGFTVRDRRDPAHTITHAITNFRQFLTLIGLTAMLVGGVGVANAVATYLERKRSTVATFRALGATSQLIFRTYLIETLMMAGIGVMAGLAIGYGLPAVIISILGDSLPVPLAFTLRPATMAIAVAYGMLVTLLFVLWPLGRAKSIRVAMLFRDGVQPAYWRPSRVIVAAIVATAVVLAGLTIASSDQHMIALYFCVGLLVLFAVFLLVGFGVRWLARRMPRSRHPELSLAISNIGGPDMLVPSFVLSLGAGLSLLITVTLVSASLRNEMTAQIPYDAPSHYFLDIGKDDIARFRKTIAAVAPKAIVADAPMLRGRIIKIAGKPVEEVTAAPRSQWVLNGDRGLTFDAKLPVGSKLAKGEWWPETYDGEPLVSFEKDIAGDLGLKIGDTVTVNILGRNITARIANLRTVDWESLAINFVMIFSPNTMKGAPFNVLATLKQPASLADDLALEARLTQRVADAFPGVTILRVKDAIEAFRGIFERVMAAIQAATGVTLLAGGLVLAGALATAQRRRMYQAVIFKSLGATRRNIIIANLAEQALLAVVTALLATVIGTSAAWIVAEKIIDVTFTFSLLAVLQTIAVALVLVFVLGAIGIWRVLGARPMAFLNSQ